MHSDFIEALNKKYACNGAEDLSGIELQHYRFASSTNERGLNAISEFEAYGFCMNGLKILDVGCAYGGFSIEAAKKGAHCYGVDIDASLYEYACLNIKGEIFANGDCEFILVDATSPEFIEKLPHNYFDLIIVNDVFEHVYDTVQLLKNLSIVANEKCTLYFDIPNGNDLRYVAREGHTGYIGLCIVSPLNWQRLTGDEIRNIYYRQYEYYQALFEYFGFEKVVPTNYPGYATEEYSYKKISDEYIETKKIISDNELNLPYGYVQHLNEALVLFDKQLNSDMKNLNAADIIWKYATKFWSGFAHRKNIALNPLTETSVCKLSSDSIENVNFKLSLKNSKLFIEVVCDFSIDEYEFAFNLARRSEQIESSEFLKRPNYEWQLKVSGMYWVTIRIRHKNNEMKIYTQPLYYSDNKEL